MKKRAFIVGAVSLASGSLVAGGASAYSDELGNLNDAIRKDIEEQILGIMLLAYVEGVIAAVQAGNYTADSLAVAYSNLRAIEVMTRNKRGAFWSDLRLKVGRALDMVVAAYESLPTTGDIEDHAREIEDESISPYIGKIPETSGSADLKPVERQRRVPKAHSRRRRAHINPARRRRAPVARGSPRRSRGETAHSSARNPPDWRAQRSA